MKRRGQSYDRKILGGMYCTKHAILRMKQRVIGEKVDSRVAERNVRTMYKLGIDMMRRKKTTPQQDERCLFIPTIWPTARKYAKDYVLVVTKTYDAMAIPVIVTVFTLDQYQNRQPQNLNSYSKPITDEQIAQYIDPGE